VETVELVGVPPVLERVVDDVTLLAVHPSSVSSRPRRSGVVALMLKPGGLVVIR